MVGFADTFYCILRIFFFLEKERSINPRKRRSANESSDFRYLEAALIVSQQFVDKYHPVKVSTILLVMANMAWIARKGDKVEYI